MVAKFHGFWNRFRIGRTICDAMDLSNVQAVYHEMVVQTMCLVVEKVWEKNQFYDELLSLKLRKVEGSPVSY